LVTPWSYATIAAADERRGNGAEVSGSHDRGTNVAVD
jgi:hypothetical protein